MNKKLYVSNLAFSMDDDALQSIFAEVGSVVSAKIITDHRSGRSKGFGFVEMSTEDEAQTAVSKLNGHEIMGRTISVAEARPQEAREPRGSGGGFRSGPRNGGGQDRFSRDRRSSY